MPANGVCSVGLEVIEDNATYASGSDSAGVSEDEDVQQLFVSGADRVTSVLPKKSDIRKASQVDEQAAAAAAAAAVSEKRYASLPNREQHQQFLTQFLTEVLNSAVFNATDRANKVLNWVDPEELQRTLDLALKDEPDTHEKLLELTRATIRHSVKTGHPYFMNQLFSSVDPYGFAGQVLTDALNPSVYTYEVSPVFVLMEEVVLREMRTIVGYPDGEGDGIFAPGGSMANGYAISCARHKFMPDIKTKGLHALPRLVIFTSEDAHYSVKKLASFMGIGSDNVYAIKTDNVGKIRVEHLESEILRAKSEGALPFMVSATAGTTVIGAFDPLEQIADLCAKYNLWMHVDAAWGGGALMSKKYRTLLKGIERSDSVTWNPHKLLAAPQQCSTLLTRHRNILAEAHSTNATYLFQKDKFYDTRYDTGDKHIQCGRRADVLKFWFMWRAKGTAGFEAHIDKVFENAEHFTSSIKARPGFEMVIEQPECTNVCFWYVPPGLRGVPRDSAEYRDRLHKVAPKVKERMMKDGSMMITYQPIHDKPNFFRLVLQNSSLDKSDMNYIIDEIERLGKDL
ncbi:cysteine sulfinic acid decarboxylase [Anopheles arabiensis]|uniref:Glutamate decarboxylase n=1 Tax=Anopheles arabiensis TaxID=7173 RepID=A0A182I7A3_ANOAR|nr:cysteine sulfinic acid decarboxylase [Anopheles arabiensis]